MITIGLIENDLARLTLTYEGYSVAATPGVDAIALPQQQAESYAFQGNPIPGNLRTEVVSLNPKRLQRITGYHRDNTLLQLQDGDDHQPTVFRCNLEAAGAVDPTGLPLTGAAIGNCVPICGGEIIIERGMTGNIRKAKSEPAAGSIHPMVRSNGHVGIAIAAPITATIRAATTGRLYLQLDYDTAAGHTANVTLLTGETAREVFALEPLIDTGHFVIAGETVSVSIRNTGAGALPLSLDAKVIR